MNTHTAAPWIYLSGSHSVWSRQSNRAVCILSGPRSIPNPEREAEREANSRLIVAAPELLEQGYRLAMLVLQSDRYTTDPDARDTVDALLALKRRIDGEQP